jgi:hypothetical protein
MPVPQIEEPERFPGGADALCDRLGYGEITTLPLGVDLATYPTGQPSDPSSGDGPALWDEAPHPSQP